MEMASHRIEVLLNFGGLPKSVSAAVGTVDHDWPVGRLRRPHRAFRRRRDRHALDDPDVAAGAATSPRSTANRGRILIDPLELTADHLLLELPEGTGRIAVEPLQEKLFDLPMVEDFAAAVESGDEPVCDAESGYWVQAVADAARAASVSGTETAVEPPGL